MPTSYTHPVQKGTVTEFKDFALQCARAMGALIMMRDEPLDAEIPAEFEPSDFYQKSIYSVVARIEEVRAMTPKQAAIMAASIHTDAVRSNTEYMARNDIEIYRYKSMLAKVNDWTPPTPDHEHFKSFMVQQLEESIRFDGGYIPAEPVKQDGSAWKSQELADLEASLARHTRSHAEEIDRTNKRNEWVQALRDSFKDAP